MTKKSYYKKNTDDIEEYDHLELFIDEEEYDNKKESVYKEEYDDKKTRL